MADDPTEGERLLHVRPDTELGRKTLSALASEPRLRVLDYLSDHVANVSEIAEALGMPLSTATLHINALEEVGLLATEHLPAARGLRKVCARTFDAVHVDLSHGNPEHEEVVEFSMPVGAFVDCEVTPTCGLACEDGIIGLFDEAASFYEPDRVHAQILWFRQGYVEYRFPNRPSGRATLASVLISMEVCSEAPLHASNWPSDITVWLNKTEIGTWTSPGDFGGTRGSLTPSWWESRNSQYGVLKVWRVGEDGSYVDGVRVSDVRLEDLDLEADDFISLRIGVRPDARHVGGLNLFGARFGNYPQDLVLGFRYRR